MLTKNNARQNLSYKHWIAKHKIIKISLLLKLSKDKKYRLDKFKYTTILLNRETISRDVTRLNGIVFLDKKYLQKIEKYVSISIHFKGVDFEKPPDILDNALRNVWKKILISVNICMRMRPCWNKTSSESFFIIKITRRLNGNSS